MRELLPARLDEVVPKADLVVLGTVESSKAYLSDDQRTLFTDYVIAPTRVIVKRGPVVSGKPGVAPPLIVQCWGGRTTIQGVPVTVVDKDFRAFEQGEQVVLVLNLDAATGKYRVAGSAFTVADDRVQAIVKHPRYDRFAGMSEGALEAEIVRLAR